MPGPNRISVEVEQTLQSLGFAESKMVVGRASIADLFLADRRCGIYVLHFADGWLYCGQALDVVRRYSNHRRIHSDIVRISFKTIGRELLNGEEQRIVETLEAGGFHLRNIALTSLPYGPSDFDQIMSLEQQERWLDDMTYQNWMGERPHNPEQRQRYRRKFEQFLSLPFAAEVITLLRSYARTAIPAVLQGEMSFWVCSCLPVIDTSGIAYSRISMNMQEVLSAFTFEDDLYFSWHLAKTPLQSSFGSNLGALLNKHPTVEIDHDHRYRPGGQDQLNLLCPASAAMAVMYDPDILRAMRIFNLRLMRKRPCYYSRNHCLDLADRIVP